MNLKEAQTLSKCHRPGVTSNAADPQVQKAVRTVSADPALKEALDAQIQFDERQTQLLDAVKPGEDFLNQIDGTLEKLQKGFQWSALRQPPFLAGAIAVLVMIGVLIYVWRGWMEDFHGREGIENMVETINHLGDKGMDAKSAQAGVLQDWFFNQGYEDFRMLPEFAAMTTTGCRVLKAGGHPVAQIVLENHGAMLSTFHTADFDLQLDPPERWRVFQDGDWAVAVRSDADTGFMIMFRGAKSDMQTFVDALH